MLTPRITEPCFGGIMQLTDLGLICATTCVAVEADNFGAPSTGVWYFVTAWYDSVGDKGYISINNGPANASSTISNVADGADALRLGSSNIGTRFWNGRIDEVMFLKRVLTADERRQMYEIGKRTHQITNDFVTTPQAAYSSGTSVTINNPYGTTNLTDTLAIGDTMIFKENVSGTETVSQAVVSNIVNTSSVYGTVTLLATPTFQLVVTRQQPKFSNGNANILI